MIYTRMRHIQLAKQDLNRVRTCECLHVYVCCGRSHTLVTACEARLTGDRMRGKTYSHALNRKMHAVLDSPATGISHCCGAIPAPHAYRQLFASIYMLASNFTKMKILFSFFRLYKLW